jgi:hypothetical protein
MYVVRDTYMSFSDAQGNSWSTLFDTLDMISNCVRSLVVVTTFLCSQSTDADSYPSNGYCQQALPMENSSTSDDSENVAAVGIAVGIYYKIWELSFSLAYPTDALQQSPVVSLQSPEEVLKIK